VDEEIYQKSAAAGLEGFITFFLIPTKFALKGYSHEKDGLFEGITIWIV
jgi:hypothetical protein